MGAAKEVDPSPHAVVFTDKESQEATKQGSHLGPGQGGRVTLHVCLGLCASGSSPFSGFA